MNVAAIRWLRLAAKIGMVLAVLGWVAQSIGVYTTFQRMLNGGGINDPIRAFVNLTVPPMLSAATLFMASGLLFIGCEIARQLNRTDCPEDES